MSYLATDGQGTVSETLDASGNATSQALYEPYGTARYTSGTSPTNHGYTGQLADAATGLDYYQARYYDPVAGQFTSADSVADGLNRYGYVGGNPTTATDPSGHLACTFSCVGAGSGGTSTPTQSGGSGSGSGSSGGSGGGDSGGSSGSGSGGGLGDYFNTLSGGNGSIVGKCYEGICIGATMMQLPCHQPLCLVGNEASGSFALAGDLDNATTIILHGTTMLEWLLNRLVNDADGVLQSGIDKLNGGAAEDGGIGGLILAAAATPCTVFCLVVGAVFEVIALAELVDGRLWSDRLKDVTRILREVDRDVSNGTISQHAASELTIVIEEHDGPLGGFDTQSFSLSMFVPAGTA